MDVRHWFCAVVLVVAGLGSVASGQDVVLGGTVVTPDNVISNGWVVIKSGGIDSILTERPRSGEARIIETRGIIFPGFVDLHNHPMYNAFERWKPAGRFKNRYEWRDLQQYKDLVGTPGSELQRKNDQTFCDLDEYAEVRALIGGTTSITGISGRRGMNPPVPKCVAGLVRNLDWASGFYGSTGSERVENALGVTPRDMKPSDAARLADAIQTNKIDLLLIHVAEGVPLDLESTVEFLALKGWNLLGKHTAIIHGIALSPDDFKQMQAVSVALVWSPRSNIELYGITTDVVTAHQQGITVALAPDWSPTGSSNMLAEIRYASHFSQEQLSSVFSDKMLFEMATGIPARIAGIDGKVGSIRQGLYADLFVLKGDSAQPFSSLARSKASDVQLVLIGGVPLYGTEGLMRQFGVPLEAVGVCGASMQLNATALPGGRLADVTQRLTDNLKKYNLRLAPLADCVR